MNIDTMQIDEVTAAERAAAIDADASPADYFRSTASKHPQAVAITTKTASFTYAEIDRWSDAIAADIIAHGPDPSVPVAIVTSDSVLLIPATLGVIKAGHFFVMIDASDPDDRIEVVLAEAGSTLCIVDESGPLPKAIGSLTRIPIRRGPPASAVAPSAEPHPFVFIVFTSGTTGKPKGVLKRRRGLVQKSMDRALRSGIGPGARVSYTVLPGFTRTGSTILLSLLAGATLCAIDVRRESLRDLAAWIKKERITSLSIPPALFRRLVAAAGDDLDFSSVRYLSLAADVVRPSDVEIFRRHFPRGARFSTGFASSETGGVFSFQIDHDTPIPGPLVPVGRLRSGVEIRLVDEDGNDVPDGEPGELIVRSSEVVDGYWRNPELTSERFGSEGDTPERRTFRSGDLIMRGDDGLYYFVGRKDFRLKIYGRRIDPSEVEAALIATGVVREAAVVGKPDPRGEMHLVSYVVPRDPATFSSRELRAQVRGSVPGWMVPARVHAIQTIPVTRAGKIDRRALVALHDPIEEFSAEASDELERTLIAIWSRVIGTPVHLDDDFFDDLGGESVVAAHLVTEVEQATGRKIPLSLLLELKSVRSMADYLRGADGAARLAVCVQPGGSLPPLFCVAGGGGSVMAFRLLAEVLGSEQPFWGLQPHSFAPDQLPTSLPALAACYVDAIRSVQPAGPYFLGGFSAGGKIAYEAARQLTQSGEQVAFLGMFDAAASAAKAPLMRRIANRLARLRLHPAANSVRFIREFRERVGRAMQRRRARRTFDRITRTDGTVPEHVRESFVAMNAAGRGFELSPYPGTVTLFRASLGLRGIRKDDDLGWSRAPISGLEILDVDGDHHSILTEPNVRSLASALRKALSQARQG